MVFCFAHTGNLNTERCGKVRCDSHVFSFSISWWAFSLKETFHWPTGENNSPLCLTNRISTPWWIVYSAEIWDCQSVYQLSARLKTLDVIVKGDDFHLTKAPSPRLKVANGKKAKKAVRSRFSGGIWKHVWHFQYNSVRHGITGTAGILLGYKSH